MIRRETLVSKETDYKIKKQLAMKKRLSLFLGTAICCSFYLAVTPFCALAAEGDQWQQTDETQWQQADGTQWQQADGTQWQQADGTQWQQADGTQWQQADEGQWQQPEGTQWQQKDGVWYLVGADGNIRTGWQQYGGRWYYLNEAGAMVTGWNKIDGKYYYFQEDGAMADGSMKVGETLYTFAPEGHLTYAKRVKNSGGGAFELAFYSQACRELADSLNELKDDEFDGDEEEDYYEDDKVDYDKDASFVISGRLTEIAQHRLEAARTKGYGNGKIPEEGTLKDYLKAISYHPGRRSMEVYLRNCDGADEAEAKLLRAHGNEEKKRSDRAVYYTEMGIAHENVDGKDYYMVLFMK